MTKITVSVPEEEKPKEIGLSVIHTSRTEDFRKRSDTDSWDRGDTHTTHTIKDVVFKNDNDGPDVTACFPVKPGDTVFLLYLVYSSGDSFGHDTDSNIEFIDVFATSEKAEAAANAIKEHQDWYQTIKSHWRPIPKKEYKLLVKKYKNERSVDIIRENGETRSFYACWNGYFESLSYVSVESFAVGVKKRIRY